MSVLDILDIILDIISSEFGIALGESSTSALNYAKNTSSVISTVARNAELATYVYGSSAVIRVGYAIRELGFAANLSIALNTVKIVGITTTFASGNYYAIATILAKSYFSRFASSISKAWP